MRRKANAGIRLIGGWRAVVRRRTALLAVFAVLFQSILFGWHHHPSTIPAPGSAPLAVAAPSGAPLLPAGLHQDGCEICAALHHLSAAPGEFVFLPAPRDAGAVLWLPARRSRGGISRVASTPARRLAPETVDFRLT